METVSKRVSMGTCIRRLQPFLGLNTYFLLRFYYLKSFGYHLVGYFLDSSTSNFVQATVLRDLTTKGPCFFTIVCETVVASITIVLACVVFLDLDLL